MGRKNRRTNIVRILLQQWQLRSGMRCSESVSAAHAYPYVLRCTHSAAFKLS